MPPEGWNGSFVANTGKEDSAPAAGSASPSSSDPFPRAFEYESGASPPPFPPPARGLETGRPLLSVATPDALLAARLQKMDERRLASRTGVGSASIWL